MLKWIGKLFAAKPVKPQTIRYIETDSSGCIHEKDELVEIVRTVNLAVYAGRQEPELQPFYVVYLSDGFRKLIPKLGCYTDDKGQLTYLD